MKQKALFAELGLEDGNCICGLEDADGKTLEETITFFNDSGIDYLLVRNLSDAGTRDKKNIAVLHKICRLSEIPVYGRSDINHPDDVRRMLEAGCMKAVFDSRKHRELEIAKETAVQFGRQHQALLLYDDSLDASSYAGTFDEIILVWQQPFSAHDFSEKWSAQLQSDADLTWSVITSMDRTQELLKCIRHFPMIHAYSLPRFADLDANVMQTKTQLAKKGIRTGHLETSIEFSDFKLDANGLIPAIVQDDTTDEILMLGYMNEESFYTTLSIGKMTYWSRSRQELWIKGLTSGHYQYVKSLALDCDNDTILARVSQVGAACHTGHRSCFFQHMVPARSDSNPMHVLREQYQKICDRNGQNASENYAGKRMDQDLDKILKRTGKKTVDLLVSSDQQKREDLKHDFSDLMYHYMELMAACDLTWEDIAEILSCR